MGKVVPGCDCCAQIVATCTSVLDGWCFQIRVGGVTNAPPTIPPGCAFCSDYNGVWLLAQSGVISNLSDNSCVWLACRPPVCCGYPTPKVQDYPRWSLGSVNNKLGVTVDWSLTSGCSDATYRLGSPYFSTGSNTFTLYYDSGACSGWPATITVIGVPPFRRSTATSGFTTFTTAYPAPGEGGTPQPWTIGSPDSNPYHAITDYLFCTGASFSIPPNAWITGVSFSFKRWADQSTSSHYAVDQTVSFLKNVASVETPVGVNLAKTTHWPAGSTKATYGGQFDLSVNNGAAFVDPSVFNSGGPGIAISVNAGLLTTGNVYIDPGSVNMTVYYVLPCTDNCCACPPISITGNPPSAYKVIFPAAPPGCVDLGPPCGCYALSGLTIELPFDSLRSIPTYVCVYDVDFGDFVLSLTITNMGPDWRNYLFTVSCDTAPLISLSTDVFGPNEAVQPCEPVTVSSGIGCLCTVVPATNFYNSVAVSPIT